MEEKAEYSGISRNQLAQDMLEWHHYQRAADERAAAIRDTVMDLGETVTTGTVRASYSKGRKSYDYHGAAVKEMAPWAEDERAAQIVSRLTLIEKVDWRLVCKDAEIDDIPFTESNPSVTIKVLD